MKVPAGGVIPVYWILHVPRILVNQLIIFLDQYVQGCFCLDEMQYASTRLIII